MSQFQTISAPDRSPSCYDDGESEVDQIDDDENVDPNVFAIRNAVQPATGKLVAMKDLHDMCHQCTIDLEAPYQRDPVWPKSKQISLIDSLFRNLWVPPLVFAVSRPPGYAEDVWICVDGKQRLTSIMRFMDGTNPHKDPVTNVSWYYTGSGTGMKNRKIIPDDFKKEFDSRTLHCVFYHDLSEPNEREIFQRVQLGVPLTPGEKLQAINTPRGDWISLLVRQHITLTGGLAELVTFETSRARDFQNVAFLAWCCEGYPTEERVPSYGAIEKWLLAEDSPSKTIKSQVNSALIEFGEIARHKQCGKELKKLESVKRIAPVEFIFIGVLLCELDEETTLEDKTTAICTLVNSVRQEYVDVRTNTTVCKTLWRYINQLCKDPLRPVTMQKAVVAAPKKGGKGKRKLADVEMEFGDAGGADGNSLSLPTTQAKKRR